MGIFRHCLQVTDPELRLGQLSEATLPEFKKSSHKHSTKLQSTRISYSGLAAVLVKIQDCSYTNINVSTLHLSWWRVVSLETTSTPVNNLQTRAAA